MSVSQFRLPPSLEPGDKIAVVATSSGVKNRFPGTLEKGVNRLRDEFGLEPEIFSTAEKGTDYLLEHPEEKAEQVMQAFRDPEIKGVVPVTGGDEEMRILKHLDGGTLEENPTRFYGISDNTNLHLFLQKHGIQSFYAGQLMGAMIADGELWEYNKNLLKKSFFEDSLGRVEEPETFSDDFIDFETGLNDRRTRYDNLGREFWNFNNKIEGRLVGGCLEVVHWNMAADRFLPDLENLENPVLALETSEESPGETEVKRWLMTMGERGILDKVSAVMVGRPFRASPHQDKTLEEKEEYHEKQKERFKKEIGRYAPETPVVFDVSFGHTDPRIPLQLGGKVALDPDGNTIEFKS